jgi:hypothetical protein
MLRLVPVTVTCAVMMSQNHFPESNRFGFSSSICYCAWSHTEHRWRCSYILKYHIYQFTKSVSPSLEVLKPRSLLIKLFLRAQKLFRTLSSYFLLLFLRPFLHSKLSEVGSYFYVYWVLIFYFYFDVRFRIANCLR